MQPLTHVDNSIIDSNDFIHSNVDGVRVLLDTLKSNKNLKKFVQVSTDEVYGSVDHGWAKEGQALNPSNPYAASKAGGELLAKSYYSTYGVPVVITRGCNTFGPFQHPEKFIPKVIMCLINKESIPVYGDGSNERSWISVEYHCDAINKIMYKGVAGEIYNVGSNFIFSNNRMIEIVKDVNGMKYYNKNNDSSQIDYVNDRLGHDFRYSMSTAKADFVKLIEHEPYHLFLDKLKVAYLWYDNHGDWWSRHMSFNGQRAQVRLEKK